MVEEVTAWRAADGTIYDTQWKALERDAGATLASFCNNAEYCSYIMNNREKIMEALGPLVEFERESDERNIAKGEA